MLLAFLVSLPYLFENSRRVHPVDEAREGSSDAIVSPGHNERRVSGVERLPTEVVAVGIKGSYGRGRGDRPCAGVTPAKYRLHVLEGSI